MSLLIFDFDGTIVDSKSVFYTAIENHLIGLGFSKNKIENTIDIGLSIGETLKKLGLSRFFAWLERREIMKDVLKKVQEIKKCRDVNSIRSIKARKILVSNSLDEFILPVLKHLKIKNEFSEIYGADDFSDKGKFIKNYIQKRNINAEECYYIGDRVADIRLARKLGIKSVIISGKCSWDSRKQLLREKPDFLLFDLKDLKDIL